MRRRNANKSFIGKVPMNNSSPQRINIGNMVKSPTKGDTSPPASKKDRDINAITDMGMTSNQHL